MQHARWIQKVSIFQLLLSLALAAPVAQGVPSFARQTGMACEACHTVFPELTHFGRMFKVNGYTLDNLKQVRDIGRDQAGNVVASDATPARGDGSDLGHLAQFALPDVQDAHARSQASTVGFPQQLSLFYAGKVAPHVGAMIQLTYADDSGGIGIDNTDLRYANNIVLEHEQSLIYGVSLNNNPTVRIYGIVRRRGAFLMRAAMRSCRRWLGLRSTARWHRASRGSPPTSVE